MSFNGEYNSDLYVFGEWYKHRTGHAQLYAALIAAHELNDPAVSITSFCYCHAYNALDEVNLSMFDLDMTMIDAFDAVIRKIVDYRV